MKLSIPFLALASLLGAAPALGLPQKTELTYSYPAAGSIEHEEVPFVQLGFGGPVDMLKVEIVRPDSTQTELYNASTNLVPMKKNAMFAITLENSLITPGEYRINYVIATRPEGSSAKTRASSFTFTLDLPQPATASADDAVTDPD
jgi:methionine-rich copper-binding protein CopC